jgi:hypothetical protein
LSPYPPAMLSSDHDSAHNAQQAGGTSLE